MNEERTCGQCNNASAWGFCVKHQCESYFNTPFKRANKACEMLDDSKLRVYIVFEYYSDLEDHEDFKGVFSTKEKAELFVEELKKVYKEGSLKIVESIVDVKEVRK